MKIYNVRLGLATNSSSSHSLIFLKEGIKAYDYAGYHHSTDPWENTTEERMGEFGWQRFTAASPQAKMRYLGVMLRERLCHELPPTIAEIICKDWLDNVSTLPDDMIDHQSLHYLPSQFNTKIPDEGFFKALKAYFLQERLIVLGGNDNEQAQHTLDDGTTFNLPIPKDVGSRYNYTCRHDDEYDYWTVFCPYDGRKIRFRLTNDPSHMEQVPEKASAPELVDIKITDYCPYACEFCYQSSTTKGKHADGYEIYRLARALGELKVFEVALGGGEPTLHPDFENILHYFRESGVVPNFTTKNLNWLRDPRKWIKIMENAGAFALSIDNEQQIKDLATLLDYNGILHERANLHIVMGTVDKWTFSRMLKTAHDNMLSVTLLGYKKHGFGLDFVMKPYEWWLNEVMSRDSDRPYGATVSIDTVLAAEYQTQIEESGIPKWMYDVQDGRFSCYIDAVEGMIGPSSYCGKEQMLSLREVRGEQYRDESLVIKEAFSYF
jgi:hypothetical protein